MTNVLIVKNKKLISMNSVLPVIVLLASHVLKFGATVPIMLLGKRNVATETVSELWAAT